MKTSCLLLILGLVTGCRFFKKEGSHPTDVEFPSQLVHFTPYQQNPVFKGTGEATWDQLIRERGYILKEGNSFYLWYTGYKSGTNQQKFLGYASSSDGLHWTRYSQNPIYSADWVEDMSVIKSDGVYYIVAEGQEDVAHLLVSTDRIHWQERGPLDIRYRNGTPLSKGPYGTPTIWKENKVWYLFYERKDQAIWLATSSDLAVWTNGLDEPVLKKGPELYDQYGVAMDQIIKYNGRYYGYYHATAFKDWHEWSTNIAVSTDLIHWRKYSYNPIVRNNCSSGLVIPVGDAYWLYTMHPVVNVYFPKK